MNLRVSPRYGDAIKNPALSLITLHPPSVLAFSSHTWRLRVARWLPQTQASHLCSSKKRRKRVAPSLLIRPLSLSSKKENTSPKVPSTLHNSGLGYMATPTAREAGKVTVCFSSLCCGRLAGDQHCLPHTIEITAILKANSFESPDI